VAGLRDRIVLAQYSPLDISPDGRNREGYQGILVKNLHSVSHSVWNVTDDAVLLPAVWTGFWFWVGCLIGGEMILEWRYLRFVKLHILGWRYLRSAKLYIQRPWLCGCCDAWWRKFPSPYDRAIYRMHQYSPYPGLSLADGVWVWRRIWDYVVCFVGEDSCDRFRASRR
jgi:hypothetical protein